MTTYVPAKEVSKLIRKELKVAYPAVKFSVRTDHHSAVRIGWQDGPTAKQVEAIVGKYEGSTFDAYADCFVPADNGDVHYGSRFVFTERSYSEHFMSVVVALINLDWGTELTVFNGYGGAFPQNHNNARIGYEWADQYASRVAQQQTLEALEAALEQSRARQAEAKELDQQILAESKALLDATLARIEERKQQVVAEETQAALEAELEAEFEAQRVAAEEIHKQQRAALEAKISELQHQLNRKQAQLDQLD